MIIRWISILYFKLAGWKLVGEKPPYQKYVFIMAPHTSQIDFVLGKMFCSLNGLKPRFLIKKEAFWFPLGIILRALGGVPVDRQSNQRLAEQLVKEFDNNKEFILVITPEGTRKKVTRWKKGFHYIARQANVPVALAFLDFKTRSLGVGPVIHLTDDYEEDIRKIKAFYRDKQARHPERFSV